MSVLGLFIKKRQNLKKGNKNTNIHFRDIL